MLRLCAAVLATLLLANTTPAAASTVIASGTTVGDDYIYLLNPIEPGSWELVIKTEAPVFDFDTVGVHGRTHFHYEYDDPTLSWGSESEDYHPFTVKKLADGIAVRFYIPHGYTRRYEDPRFPYTFYRFSEGIFVMSGSVSSDTPAAWSATISAAPEPTAWLIMIVGFGAVGAALRRQLPSPVLLGVQRRG